MRWIGVGLMAAAAATMVLGDALAATPRASFTLRFDLFTPAGVACEVDAPDAAVRIGRDLLGKPIVTVTGALDTAAITCTTPDGLHWRTGLPRDSRAPIAATVEALATWRPGADRMALFISPGMDQFATPEIHRFTRLD